MIQSAAPFFLVECGVRRAELEVMSVLDVADVLDYWRATREAPDAG
jgi:hypothetical protein